MPPRKTRIDRINSITITLDKDIRIDDAEDGIMKALYQLRGVIDATPNVTNVSVHAAHFQAREEMRGSWRDTAPQVDPPSEVVDIIRSLSGKKIDGAPTYDLCIGDMVVAIKQITCKVNGNSSLYIHPGTFGIVIMDDEAHSGPYVRWDNLSVGSVKDGDVTRLEECCVCRRPASLKQQFCPQHNSNDWRGECCVCAGLSEPGTNFCEHHEIADWGG